MTPTKDAKAAKSTKSAKPAKAVATPKVAKAARTSAEGSSKRSVTLTQLRMPIDTKQALALQGLGLRRIRHQVSREDTPSVRGLILKVRHLVEVAEAKN
jgi:large subunit ribosomal protein L30